MSFAYSSLRSLGFFLLVYRILYIFRIRILCGYSIANTFSYSMALFFIPLMVSFGEKTFLILHSPIYHL